MEDTAKTAPPGAQMANAKAPQNKNEKLRSLIKVLVTIVLVSLVQALALSAFYVAYDFPSTGITGFAQVINYVTGLPVPVMVVVLNLPIMVWALRKGERRFVGLSIFSTLVFATIFGLVENFRLPDVNPILAAIFGGAIVGGSGSFVVKQGGSMGGLDTLTVLLSKKLSISKATIDLAINMILILALLFIKGLESCMLLVVAMMASSKAFDAMIAGYNRTMTVLIVSAHSDEIAPLILEKMVRGVTLLDGKGAFTGQERHVIYCVIRTLELSALKDIVRSVDPAAICSIIDTKEVTGRGFAAL